MCVFFAPGSATIEEIPKLLYVDIYGMQAVTMAGKFPLQAKLGKDVLYWEPLPGVQLDTNIPYRFHGSVLKRPCSKIGKEKDEGSVLKRPCSRTENKKEAKQEENDDEEGEGSGGEGGEEEEQEEEEEEEEEAEDYAEDMELEEEEEDMPEGEEEEEDEGANEDEEMADKDNEEEEQHDKEKDDDKDHDKEKKKQEVQKQEKKKKPKLEEKQAPKEKNEVETVYLHNAHTGPHIRSYIIAKMGTWKSQVVQISAKESRKYQTLTIKLHNEMVTQIEKKITFGELRAWAAQRKQELLT